jgi:hypothetical protein
VNKVFGTVRPHLDDDKSTTSNGSARIMVNRKMSLQARSVCIP